MIRQKRTGWGKGWDYLFKDIWSNLDQIRIDNLNRKYDYKNIDFCFSHLYSILIKSIIPKIKDSSWSEKDKTDILEKAYRIIKLFKEANSYPDKVIAINTTEQFLRAIY